MAGRLTLFEYIAAALSLVFSFSAVRLLDGLPAALEPERRYPVHISFLAQQLFAVAAGFWPAWSLREVAWSFSRWRPRRCSTSSPPRWRCP